MCLSIRKHSASENRSLFWCLNNYLPKQAVVKKILARIADKKELSKHAKILEVGCAQGLYLFAFCELGYNNVFGLEPSGSALKTLEKLSKRKKVSFPVRRGVAENIPYPSANFDLVIAESVLEHVNDIAKSFLEISRVLKKGGIFYFSTTSIVCPYQGEIRFFPFFSWYPDKVKRMVMLWAKKKHPSLIGNTKTPALNWFSYRKTRKLAKEAGFREIFSRWDLASPNSNSAISSIRRLIATNMLFKFIADFFVPGSTYLLIK